MRFRQLLGMIFLAVAITAPAGGFVYQQAGEAGGNSASPAKPAAPTAVNTAPQINHVSHISSITVAPDKDGLTVQINGDSSIAAKAMKLSHPDRIVLDIPDSVLIGHSREIAVNQGDIKDVRAAHFQDAPPTTRVVVDMATMHEFEVLPAGKTLTLKLKNAETASHANSVTREVVAQQLPAPVQPEIKTVATKPTQPEAVSKPAEPVAQATGSTTSAIKPVAKSGGADSKSDAPISVSILVPPKDVESGQKKEAAVSQSRGDEAAAHFVMATTPALLSTSKTPVAGNASLSAQPALVNASLQQQQQATVTTQPSTSCTSGHYSGAPLNLDLKDLDIKDFFRLIHEISGLNVVLDPGVRGIVTIDVTDIPWDQALAIVLRNNGLECQLEGNVLRVATLETLRAEADARRAEQEAQAMAIPRQNYTRMLSYAHSKDVAVVLKKFLSPRGDIVADDRSNAVIIEDIPTVLPKIDALLMQLDRKTPEVEIEARVVSATRNFARDIGTQLGFGWGNGVTGTGGGTGVVDPVQQAFPSGVTPPWITIPNQPGQIPLFSNLPATGPTSGISFINSTSTYRLDFTLTMAESRGLVKVLSRPRVVTQNNISALIRQGQRIPVVTLAQLGGPPTVTYVDAFLRLTVTPQITNENTIFLLLDVENTTADFTHVTGQQVNPTLDTQQATTQVLVSDGQTVVIGGVIQTTNNLAINQVPLLGSIPILGNLFKHVSVNNTTAELLFFITPKIIQT